MGLFGKGFGTGLAEGLATGASRTIQTALDKREEEASAARKYMQQRAIQKAERYESDEKEMKNLLEGFADLTGGDLDKAAQLIKGAGGIERAGARLDMLREERLKNKDFNINTLYTFSESQTNSENPRTVSDYAFNLLEQPSAVDQLPKRKKFGLVLQISFFLKQKKLTCLLTKVQSLKWELLLWLLVRLGLQKLQREKTKQQSYKSDSLRQISRR